MSFTDLIKEFIRDKIFNFNVYSKSKKRYFLLNQEFNVSLVNIAKEIKNNGDY